MTEEAVVTAAVAVVSTDIYFLHQSTGCLPVPGCTNNHAYMSKSKPSTSMATYRCEVTHASMARKLVATECAVTCLVQELNVGTP